MELSPCKLTRLCIISTPAGFTASASSYNCLASSKLPFISASLPRMYSTACDVGKRLAASWIQKPASLRCCCSMKSSARKKTKTKNHLTISWNKLETFLHINYISSCPLSTLKHEAMILHSVYYYKWIHWMDLFLMLKTLYRCSWTSLGCCPDRGWP